MTLGFYLGTLISLMVLQAIIIFALIFWIVWYLATKIMN